MLIINKKKNSIELYSSVNIINPLFFFILTYYVKKIIYLFLLKNSLGYFPVILRNEINFMEKKSS